MHGLIGNNVQNLAVPDLKAEVVKSLYPLNMVVLIVLEFPNTQEIVTLNVVRLTVNGKIGRHGNHVVDHVAEV